MIQFPDGYVFPWDNLHDIILYSEEQQKKIYSDLAYVRRKYHSEIPFVGVNVHVSRTEREGYCYSDFETSKNKKSLLLS